MEAVQVRSPESVKVLVSGGADTKLKNKEGKSAVDYTTGDRNGACAKILADG